jgi:hypothetical protein
MSMDEKKDYFKNTKMPVIVTSISLKLALRFAKKSAEK